MNKMEVLATVIAETVAEQGENGAPSGVVFAALTGVCSYAEYIAIVAELKKVGLVTERFHVLYWIGVKGAKQ